VLEHLFFRLGVLPEPFPPVLACAIQAARPLASPVALLAWGSALKAGVVGLLERVFEVLDTPLATGGLVQALGNFFDFASDLCDR